MTRMSYLDKKRQLSEMSYHERKRFILKLVAMASVMMPVVGNYLRLWALFFAGTIDDLRKLVQKDESTAGTSAATWRTKTVVAIENGDVTLSSKLLGDKGRGASADFLFEFTKEMFGKLKHLNEPQEMERLRILRRCALSGLKGAKVFRTEVFLIIELLKDPTLPDATRGSLIVDMRGIKNLIVNCKSLPEQQEAEQAILLAIGHLRTCPDLKHLLGLKETEIWRDSPSDYINMNVATAMKLGL